MIKSSAVVFLLSQNYILGSVAPGTILLAAVFDGIMGLSVAGVLIVRACVSEQPLSMTDDS